MFSIVFTRDDAIRDSIKIKTHSHGIVSSFWVY